MYRSYSRCESLRLAAIVLVLALHATALYALLKHKAARDIAVGPTPISVSLIAPAAPPVQPAPPPVVQPKPRPAVRNISPPQPQRTARQTVITAPADTGSTQAQPVTRDVAPPTPEPAAAPSAPSVAAATEVAAAAPAPPRIARAETQTAPVFNADYLNNPAPAYPPLSRRTGEEGKVVLRVFVNEQGEAADVQLRASSGHSRLDEAALAAVRRWRFVPARRGDATVGAWVLVPIAFNLRS